MGKDIQKFKNSLISNAEYLQRMKNQIFKALRMLNQGKITDKDPESTRLGSLP